ncbi:MAG: NAD(P)-binding domain-containing protein [Roseiflexaceae bacterium]
MEIAIFGTGNVGQRLGALLGRAGHRIVFGSRDPEASRARLTDAKGAQVATYAAAAEASTVVIVAVPWAGGAALEALAAAGPLDGKLVIDCTNPLAPDWLSNTLGHTTSSAEEIARAVPGARVVKAFNTIFAEIMVPGKQQFGDLTATGFFCGDDPAAKRIVEQLIHDAGFAPLDAGPLRNARYLEPLAQLNIQLALVQGGGMNAAFAYLRRAD